MAEVYMAGDLRNGTTFELDSQVFKVVEFQHVKILIVNQKEYIIVQIKLRKNCREF